MSPGILGPWSPAPCPPPQVSALGEAHTCTPSAWPCLDPMEAKWGWERRGPGACGLLQGSEALSGQILTPARPPPCLPSLPSAP